LNLILRGKIKEGFSPSFEHIKIVKESNMLHLKSNHNVIVYRIGNREEENFYKKGEVPAMTGVRRPMSVWYTDNLKCIQRHIDATNKGLTQSKGNKMNTLFQLVIDKSNGALFNKVEGCKNYSFRLNKTNQIVKDYKILQTF
jgi:hypothetical protein